MKDQEMIDTEKLLMSLGFSHSFILESRNFCTNPQELIFIANNMAVVDIKLK